MITNNKMIKNKKHPIISVIVPTLNEEKYIEKTLESIGNQIFSNFELILSDGNSSDGTVKISKRYVDKIVISSKRGIGTQQNLGAKIARGNILVFVHADAIIKRDLLIEIVKAIKSGYIGGGCTVRTMENSYKNKLLNNFIRFLNKILNKFNIMCTGDVLFFRKDVFIKHNGFRDVFFEDSDIFLRIRKDGKLALLKSVVSVSDRRSKKDFWKEMILKWVPFSILTLLGKPRKIEYVPAR